MNRVKKILAVSVIMLMLMPYATLSRADEGHPHQKQETSGKHEHQALHGGKMVTVGSHHIEVVVEGGGVIKIFLYDGEDRPVAVRDVRGQIHITFPDNHRETLELVPSADQTHLTARLKNQDHPRFKAVLSLVINGQRQNIRLNM